jgi:N-acetylneuraminic acid mutarotase
MLASCTGGSPQITSPTSRSERPAPTPSTLASSSASPTPTGSSATDAVARWSRLRPASAPARREDHTWTADESGTYAYLFGGRDGARVYGDLWRYDLAKDTWARLSTRAGPAARFGHTGTWLNGRGLVIWSGQAGSAFFDDLWLYDAGANRWQRLPARGAVPLARYGSCAAVGPDGRLWISHGFTNDAGRFSDTRAYDLASGRWSDETPKGELPVVRCLHDCLWAPDGRLLLYGGQTTGVRAIGDLWSLRAPPDGAAAWSREPMPPFPPRNLYAVAELDGRAYVFGGTPLSGAKLADLWQLDLRSGAWSSLRAGAGPSGRSGATLIADRTRQRLVLFGGIGDAAAMEDSWELRLRG